MTHLLFPDYICAAELIPNLSVVISQIFFQKESSLSLGKQRTDMCLKKVKVEIN